MELFLLGKLIRKSQNLICWYKISSKGGQENPENHLRKAWKKTAVSFFSVLSSSAPMMNRLIKTYFPTAIVGQSWEAAAPFRRSYRVCVCTCLPHRPSFPLPAWDPQHWNSPCSSTIPHVPVGKEKPRGNNWLVPSHIEKELSFILKSTLQKIKSWHGNGIQLPSLHFTVQILTLLCPLPF